MYELYLKGRPQRQFFKIIDLDASEMYQWLKNKRTPLRMFGIIVSWQNCVRNKIASIHVRRPHLRRLFKCRGLMIHQGKYLLSQKCTSLRAKCHAQFASFSWVSSSIISTPKSMLSFSGKSGQIWYPKDF